VRLPHQTRLCCTLMTMSQRFTRLSRTCVVWPAASTCSVTVGAWQQCGGTSNCASGVTCTDAQWYVNLNTISICKTHCPVQSQLLSTPSACNTHACITNFLAWLEPLHQAFWTNHTGRPLHGGRLKGCLHQTVSSTAWQGQHLLADEPHFD